jgi:hypothetical protein
MDVCGVSVERFSNEKMARVVLTRVEKKPRRRFRQPRMKSVQEEAWTKRETRWERMVVPMLEGRGEGREEVQREEGHSAFNFRTLIGNQARGGRKEQDEEAHKHCKNPSTAVP